MGLHLITRCIEGRDMSTEKHIKRTRVFAYIMQGVLKRFRSCRLSPVGVVLRWGAAMAAVVEASLVRTGGVEG